MVAYWRRSFQFSELIVGTVAECHFGYNFYISIKIVSKFFGKNCEKRPNNSKQRDITMSFSQFTDQNFHMISQKTIEG